MATLTGTLFLSRAILSEVVEDPNVTPRTVVAGTAGGIGGGSGKSDTTTLDGSFRTYGNGNTRLILGSGQTRTQTLALRALSPAQVQTVRDLMGLTVCYRDTYGRRIFGSYTSIQVTDIAGSGSVQAGTLLTDVGLVIQSTTYVEAV